ncbi:MAG: hypothetical protein ACRDHZ_01895 [Ktedonobacteraceae bacterium]
MLVLQETDKKEEDYHDHILDWAGGAQAVPGVNAPGNISRASQTAPVLEMREGGLFLETWLVSA